MASPNFGTRSTKAHSARRKRRNRFLGIEPLEHRVCLAAVLPDAVVFHLTPQNVDHTVGVVGRDTLTNSDIDGGAVSGPSGLPGQMSWVLHLGNNMVDSGHVKVNTLGDAFWIKGEHGSFGSHSFISLGNSTILNLVNTEPTNWDWFSKEAPIGSAGVDSDFSGLSLTGDVVFTIAADAGAAWDVFSVTVTMHLAGSDSGEIAAADATQNTAAANTDRVKAANVQPSPSGGALVGAQSLTTADVSTPQILKIDYQSQYDVAVTTSIPDDGKHYALGETLHRPDGTSLFYIKGFPAPGISELPAGDFGNPVNVSVTYDLIALGDAAIRSMEANQATDTANNSWPGYTENELRRLGAATVASSLVEFPLLTSAQVIADGIVLDDETELVAPPSSESTDSTPASAKNQDSRLQTLVDVVNAAATAIAQPVAAIFFGSDVAQMAVEEAVNKLSDRTFQEVVGTAQIVAGGGEIAAQVVEDETGLPATSLFDVLKSLGGRITATNDAGRAVAMFDAFAAATNGLGGSLQDKLANDLRNDGIDVPFADDKAVFDSASTAAAATNTILVGLSNLFGRSADVQTEPRIDILNPAEISLSPEQQDDAEAVVAGLGGQANPIRNVDSPDVSDAAIGTGLPPEVSTQHLVPLPPPPPPGSDSLTNPNVLSTDLSSLPTVVSDVTTLDDVSFDDPSTFTEDGVENIASSLIPPAPTLTVSWPDPELPSSAVDDLFSDPTFDSTPPISDDTLFDDLASETVPQNFWSEPVYVEPPAFDFSFSFGGWW